MSECTIAYGDDWQALYVNGELKHQGHSLDAGEVIEILTGSRPSSFEADAQSIEDVGFPELLSDVVRA